MEFKSGSELVPADGLRQAKMAVRWMATDPKLELRAWWGWLEGWPQAKTAVIEAEREVQQFEVPWAEAWARAKARVWAEVKVLLAGRASGEQGAAEERH